jgi:hypothetical protein
MCHLGGGNLLEDSGRKRKTKNLFFSQMQTEVSVEQPSEKGNSKAVEIKYGRKCSVRRTEAVAKGRERPLKNGKTPLPREKMV